MTHPDNPFNEPIPYFREVQKYSSWWVILMLMAAIGGVVFRLVYFSMMTNVYHYMRDETKLQVDAPWFLIAIFIIIVSIITYLLMQLKLVTEVRETGVMFRFHLTNRKPRWIPCEAIQSFDVVRFGPDQVILDGLFRRKPNHKAYFINGDVAIRITTKYGNIIQLGTRKPNGFYDALKKIVPEAAMLNERIRQLLAEKPDREGAKR